MIFLTSTWFIEDINAEKRRKLGVQKAISDWVFLGGSENALLRYKEFGKRKTSR
jgi:hypothetical protein